MQQSRKKNNFPDFQLGQGHLSVEERRLGTTSFSKSCYEGRASTTWAFASAALFFAVLFMLSNLLPAAPVLSFSLGSQPFPFLGSSLAFSGFLLCLQYESCWTWPAPVAFPGQQLTWSSPCTACIRHAAAFR